MTHGIHAHIWTAGAYFLIGGALILLAIRIWWTHPINRAFLFGPYLTPAGVRVLLHHWPLVFLFGAFIFACALDHAAEALATLGWWPKLLTADFLKFLATGEAVVSVVTALVVMLVARRAWTVR